MPGHCRTCCAQGHIVAGQRLTGCAMGMHNPTGRPECHLQAPCTPPALLLDKSDRGDDGSRSPSGTAAARRQRMCGRNRHPAGGHGPGQPHRLFGTTHRRQWLHGWPSRQRPIHHRPRVQQPCDPTTHDHQCPAARTRWHSLHARPHRMPVRQCCYLYRIVEEP